MPSPRYFLWVIGVLFLFGGCSAKEFNEGAKGIANDISKLFEVRE